MIYGLHFLSAAVLYIFNTMTSGSDGYDLTAYMAKKPGNPHGYEKALVVSNPQYRYSSALEQDRVMKLMTVTSLYFQFPIGKPGQPKF